MVSIVILSYNTKALLRECLESVFSSLGKFSFEVIVFDNASSDDSVHMVKREFPKVVLLESDTNLGFGKGVNAASKKAKGEYLLFLNSDAMLLDDHLEVMVQKMEENSEIGIIGGNLLQNDDTTSEAYGSFYNITEVLRFLYFRKKTRPRATSELSIVDWVSGGYMLIRKELFLKLSGFDEHFFMYIEDMELCYRLRKEGFKVCYFKAAEAKHLGQGSSNRSFAIVNIYKGLLYFYKKHKPKWEYFVVQLLLLMKAVAGFFVGIITGNKYLRETYASALRVII